MIARLEPENCRHSVYATVLLVSCLCTCFSVHAEVYPVVVHSQFNNDNWFPLPAREMESAAVDTALSGLSRSRSFAFLHEAGQAKKIRATGDLYLTVTLVEPAETAKITIKLNLPGNAGTYVSTASGSLSNKGYQAIFGVFEEIGRAASEQINEALNEPGKQDDSRQAVLSQPLEQIISLNQNFINLELVDTQAAHRIDASGMHLHNEKVLAELGKLEQIISKLDAHHEYVKKQDAVTAKKLDDIYAGIQSLGQNLSVELPDRKAMTEVDVTALGLLEASLKHKYRHAYENADKKLEQALALNPLSPRVRELLEAEKNYNLPLFEAQAKTTELRLGFMEMRNDGSYRDHISHIRSIYVNILKQKDTDFRRQVEVKQKLDELMLMSGDMDVVDKFASKTAYQNFKRLMMTWDSRQMVLGGGKSTCPNDEELGQMVKQASLLTNVHAVKEIKYGCEVVFRRAARDYVIVKGSDMRYEVIESSSF